MNAPRAPASRNASIVRWTSGWCATTPGCRSLKSASPEQLDVADLQRRDQHARVGPGDRGVVPPGVGVGGRHAEPEGLQHPPDARRVHGDEALAATRREHGLVREHRRHVGPERGSELGERERLETARPDLVDGEQRGRRIGAAPAEARCHRDALVEPERDARATSRRGSSAGRGPPRPARRGSPRAPSRRGGRAPRPLRPRSIPRPAPLPSPSRRRAARSAAPRSPDRGSRRPGGPSRAGTR